MALDAPTLAKSLRSIAQRPTGAVGLPVALTADEQAGGMMATGKAPDVRGLASALRQIAGPSAMSRMQERGARQTARFRAGERRPSPVTGEDAALADDLAGGILGNIPGPLALAAAVRAYHATQQRFDRFSLDRIGSGDGGAMLGHGLHFSSKREVARRYGSTVYDVALDDSRILDIRKNVKDLSPDMRSKLETAGLIQPPVEAVTRGARTEFRVGDRIVRIVEQSPNGALQHFNEYGQDIRPTKANSIESIRREVQDEHPNSGRLTQILDGGQVSRRLADRLKDAGIGGIVDTDLSAKSAAGRRGGPTDVFLIFDDSLIDITHVDGSPVTAAERAEELAKRRDKPPGMTGDRDGR